MNFLKGYEFKEKLEGLLIEKMLLREKEDWEREQVWVEKLRANEKEINKLAEREDKQREQDETEKEKKYKKEKEIEERRRACEEKRKELEEKKKIMREEKERKSYLSRKG